MNPHQEDVLIAWYADDFTGAAAVLEVLAFAGVKAMLFLEAPSKQQLLRYPGLQAIGVASTARAQSPDWMDEHLPSAFESLLSHNPQLLHYKICTTLDSSPSIGSIGRAIELAFDVIQPDSVPLLVAAPQMGRYQVYGHLFAAMGGEVFRLDRHPVMARHPVTPMNESDVAKHISAQSQRVEATCLQRGKALILPLPSSVRTEAKLSVYTIDCMDEGDEAAAGKLLWDNRAQNKFVVGSQGVEYALVKHWRAAGVIGEITTPSGAGRAKGMVVVSGSVSPTTAEQIEWSRSNGFKTIQFDVLKACSTDKDLETEVSRVVNESLIALDSDSDPIVFTAQGPDDPVVSKLQKHVVDSGQDISDINESIGNALGQVLLRVLSKSDIRRAIVSGGDTAGAVTKQLGVFALSAVAPTIPGASLSRVHAEGAMDGLELALKGGQMGTVDYFAWIRDGGGER